MTTTRLPAWSRSSGHCCGCTIRPRNRSTPSHSRLVRLLVVVVALAHQQEAGREPHPLAGVGAGDVDGPPPLLARPGDRRDPVVVADVARQVVVLDDLVEVVQDRRPRGDRRAAPRLEPVAVGEQVAVGADTGEPVGPPRAAPVVLGLQDHQRPVREPLLQVARSADPGHPRPDDQDVDVAGVPDLLGGPRGNRCTRHRGTSCRRPATWPPRGNGRGGAHRTRPSRVANPPNALAAPLPPSRLPWDARPRHRARRRAQRRPADHLRGPVRAAVPGARGVAAAVPDLAHG